MRYIFYLLLAANCIVLLVNSDAYFSSEKITQTQLPELAQSPDTPVVYQCLHIVNILGTQQAFSLMQVLQQSDIRGRIVSKQKTNTTYVEVINQSVPRLSAKWTEIRKNYPDLRIRNVPYTTCAKR